MDYRKEFVLAKMVVKFTFGVGWKKKSNLFLLIPLPDNKYYKAVWDVYWITAEKKDTLTDEDWWLSQDSDTRNDGEKQTDWINFEWLNAFKNADIDI